MKGCAKCGRPVWPTSTWCRKCAPRKGRPNLSGLSRKEYVKRYRKEAEEALPDVILACAMCGGTFTSKNPSAKMCGVTCRNRYAGKFSNSKRDYGTRKCTECGKEYGARAKLQKYCSSPCFRKAEYARNIESHRAHDRVKVRRQQIGLNIRDETLQTPSRRAKWLWDGIGMWSRKYPDITECLECNTNVYVHNANGVCEYCYDKLRQRDEEDVKRIKALWYRRAREEGTYRNPRTESEEWIGKARNREIPVTPKIENLLDNLERL